MVGRIKIKSNFYFFNSTQIYGGRESEKGGEK